MLPGSSLGGHPTSSFEEVVLPHVDRLFRLAMWLSRDRTEAEDIVQETLFQALTSFHRFTPGTNIRGWLFAILRHVRSKRRRTAWRTDPLDDEQLDREPAPDIMVERLTDDEVLAALSTLPEGFQEVVILCDVEELTYREAAQAMALPIGTVMSRLHRARKRLRVTLAAAASERGIGVGAGRVSQ
ncbi:MAG: sigma-70 family RNA polymerase sigma factor [Vicinamibacterales bacterium]